MSVSPESIEAAGTAKAQAETPRKHCWECQRRRLVCDSTRPVCSRCRTSGLVCPGYDEKQPLRWVKPGRVTARTRRRAKAAGGPAAGVAKKKKQPDNTAGGGDCVDGDVIDANIADRTPSSTDEDFWSEGDLIRELDALYLQGARQPRSLEAIMRYDIACENFAGVKASYIYSCEVYERASPLILLSEDPRFKLPAFPPSIAHLLPASIQGLFILFALGHQIHRLPPEVEANVRERAQSAVSFWTYQVIRTLNAEMTQEENRTSDATMTGVLMLMMASQQLLPSGAWRHHYHGLMQMLRLRGGVEKVWNECPHMHSGILSMVLAEVFGNTTSPSHDLVTELSHPKHLNFLKSAWGSTGDVRFVYVGSICPSSLFSNVVQINHLRALATQGIPDLPLSTTSTSPSLPSSLSSPSSSTLSCSSHEDDMPVYTEPHTILNQILNFSPEAYASTNSNERTWSKWLLVGRVHQSAVALYCILSLQHILLLPESEALSRTVRTHYDRLLLDLKEGYKHGNLKNCFLWPLVVGGVGAVNGTAFERAFIADTLRDSAPHMGSAMPVMARKILMEFWDSGKKGWDDCFDQPYIFIM
ncbi:hypothetical protein F5Y01DRAFT_171121 [Xylaria sp. FL0043]|nr:hypothetical protein F5Y01DRAFT_171121 [Xylaria sp. FL0043]